MAKDVLEYVVEPGVLDIPKLRADGLYPSDERIAAGPVAVFECGQEIPCNPCKTACKKGYIEIGEDITKIPKLDERCTGCGLCLPSCPGLCIFVLNGAYSKTEATITVPYELLPLPEPDQIVDSLDRKGSKVCDGRVVKCQRQGKDELCYSLTVAIPKQYIHEVRHFRRKMT